MEELERKFRSWKWCEAVCSKDCVDRRTKIHESRKLLKVASLHMDVLLDAPFRLSGIDSTK